MKFIFRQVSSHAEKNISQGIVPGKVFSSVPICSKAWYTNYVVQPIPGNGRRWSLYGNCNLFSCLLHGWCSLPLHHQMVRRWQVGQHWPSGFLSTINKQEEALSIRSTEGFIFVHMDLQSLLPTGIIAYANLEINIPTCLKSRKISAICHKNAIKLYLFGFFHVWKHCKIKAFQSFP